MFKFGLSWVDFFMQNGTYSSDSVATDLQKLKDVLQNDPKY